MYQVDVSNKPSPHSRSNRLLRAIWTAVCVILFRPSPKVLHAWRRFLLRCFGARLGTKVIVHPSARIWAPWNMIMGDYSTVGPFVDYYCAAPITIGSHTVISQYTVLCSARHDYEHPNFSLLCEPIKIGSQCWLAADVFVGSGVTIGEGTVVGARSTVLHNLPPWRLCVGTPAKAVRARVLKSQSQ